MGVNLIGPDDRVVEIAPGRGDLRRTSQSSSPYMPFPLPLLGGKQVSFAKLYASQPTVAIAGGWLLRQVSRVPLKVYRRTGDDSRERLRPADHPLAAAIAAPWDRGSQLDLVRHLLGSRIVHGNAVMEVEEGRSGALRFVHADWRCLEPIMPWRDEISGWKLDTDDPSVTRTRSADEVLHIAAWSPFGPIGISPLQQLGVTLRIEDAAQRHQEAMWKNSATPSAIVEAAAEFLGRKPEEVAALMDQLRGDITDLYAGPDNSGRPVLLPPGLEWKPAGHNAQEAALIEQRHCSREEAAGIYGLNLAAFGIFDRTTQVNELRQANYLDGLAPPLIEIEMAINAQIARGMLREDDVYVEHDFAGVLRGDMLKEIEALREAIGSAMLTPNEARAIRNMPQSDIEAMNKFFLPFNNLWPIDQDPPKAGRNLEQADVNGGSD